VFYLNHILLNTVVSSEAASNSAVGMLGSFIAAGILIVAPAAAALIWVSQNDQLSRGR